MKVWGKSSPCPWSFPPSLISMLFSHVSIILLLPSLPALSCTIHCFLPTHKIHVTVPFSFNLPCLSLSCFFSWVLSSAFLPPLIIPPTTYRCIYSSRGSIHTGFHHFTEISQTFHNKYIFSKLLNLAHILSEWLRKLKMEIKIPKPFLGEPALRPPRSLHLRCSFRKSFSIFHRSMPVCLFLSFLPSLLPFLPPSPLSSHVPCCLPHVFCSFSYPIPFCSVPFLPFLF